MPLYRNDNQILKWLAVNILMVVMMVIIGGITRLTDSGLSMTEWKLIGGVIPPINENDWSILFEKYKNFPEFNLKNFDFDLIEFKKIFFWEYFHRFWGRLIGFSFFCPLIFYWIKNRLTNYEKKFLIILSFLGCFQAFMGWFMVKSGLVDKPDVSHFRLALHLLIALIIYSMLLFLFCKIYRNKKIDHSMSKGKSLKFLKKTLLASIILISFTIISGAFVAGTNAGLAYNNFPLMGENLLPPLLLSNQTLNLSTTFNDIGFIQFFHRSLATLTLIFIISIVVFNLKNNLHFYFKKGLILLLVSILLQYTLGIIILKLFVPFTLGLFHQLGSLIILSILTILLAETSCNQIAETSCNQIKN